MASRDKTEVWLITGTSAGLGAALVQAVRRNGYRVIATARDVESISSFSKDDGIGIIQLDVTSSQEVLNGKIKEATACFGKIDILVNNAGYILSGVWEQMSQETLYKQLDTNLLGPMRLTRALLPFLRGNGGGSIVFIGSVAGWVGAAAAGPYAMTKFALEGAAECLQKEVANFNIQVYTVDLGQFRTNVLNETKRKYHEEDPLPEYEDLILSLRTRHENTHGKQRGDPALAAQRIVDVLESHEEFTPRDDSLPVLQRIFLGPDCVHAAKKKCEETLKLIDKHSNFFSSTDYDDIPQIQGYQ